MPRKQTPIPPTCFVPSCADDFVGHASKVADVLMRKALRLRATPDQPLKLLISGAPGIGKTSLVNELDRCSKDAQDMLLTYLDRMKPGHAFLGTTNLDLGSLTERFQTRFQSVRLQPPDNEALAAFLARRWAVPIATTRMIAAGASGNVRAAMADLEMWLG